MKKYDAIHGFNVEFYSSAFLTGFSMTLGSWRTNPVVGAVSPLSSHLLRKSRPFQGSLVTRCHFPYSSRAPKKDLQNRAIISPTAPSLPDFDLWVHFPGNNLATDFLFLNIDGQIHLTAFIIYIIDILRISYINIWNWSARARSIDVKF